MFILIVVPTYCILQDGKDILPKLEQELKKIRKDFGVALVPIVTKVSNKTEIKKKTSHKIISGRIALCVTHSIPHVYQLWHASQLINTWYGMGDAQCNSARS